jgi:hypothetical protein
MSYDPIADSPLQYMRKAIALLERIDQRLGSIEKTLDQIGVGMGMNSGAITAELRAIREGLKDV